MKHCSLKIGDFKQFKNQNTYDRSYTIILLHGLYQQRKCDEIKIIQSMDLCYDQNDDDVNIDPLPSLEEAGLQRRIKHPFKIERNILFWENVPRNFVEDSGTILSLYGTTKILQFIM